MSLEQIALRVGDECGYSDPSDEESAALLCDFARRLVAALGVQEPVGRVVGQQTEWGGLGFHAIFNVGGAFRLHDGMDLFAAPPICPTCTQMIDEAAREGRILDDRIPDGWQLVPKVATGAMWMALEGVAETEDAREDCQNMWAALLAAAPEYRG